MKIIEQGIDPATVPVQAKCGKCNTRIEFLPHEAKFNSDQRDGSFYSIACPTCQSTITQDVAAARPNYYTDH